MYQRYVSPIQDDRAPPVDPPAGFFVIAPARPFRPDPGRLAP
jgi:hypothetical protein